MQYIGIGIISLVIYVASILILNIGCKRKMAEAMIWSVFLLIVISVLFGGRPLGETIADSAKNALGQEVVYAGLAFVFMAHVMDRTGTIVRLVNILNSLAGRLSGGSGYVATLGCALFGMVSGVASASTAAIGSVTIPWMRQTGWSKERSATIVAGNGGLGNVFPPSSVMMLVLGTEIVATELSADQLYVGLMSVGVFVLAYRLFLVFLFAKKDGIQKVPADQIIPLGQCLRENGSALVILLGVAIPLLLTMGPTGDFVTARLADTKGASQSISMIVYIPILITIFAIIEGWKHLPHTISGWIDLLKGSLGSFSELGVLLVFAFVASRLLVKLNMSGEFSTILKVTAGLSPAVIMIAICTVVTLMVGPFNATATTAALCGICYTALRSIGLSPVISAVAFINLVSNQSCVPPQSAPIYIASGIAEVEEPFKIFKDLIIYYALPQVLFVMLVMLKIIPVAGA
ncbi:MAG: TRAP transporter large permease subunit [Synergistaceae bacterium]|jgi:TRAP-type C4-dicarboxylate transport system permease large subunit|nr:TRAP transporter large permease subunit [Synergistaceae bacterium]